MKARSLSLFIVPGVLIAGNLLVSSLLGLGDAEALYYAYSRHLALSYLDHPPLIGWLIRGVTAVAGTTVIGVRLVPMVATLLGIVFTYLLTREMFGDKAARYAPPLLFATPLFSIGLTAATPDAPLFAIWPLYLWQLHIALSDRRAGIAARWVRPVFLGLLLGLAFLAKYTGALLVVTTLILLARREHRVWFGRPGLWLGAALALALSLPVFLWNLDHHFAGVRHRLDWTQTGAGFSMRNLGALVGGQLLYMGPVMLLLFYRAVKGGFHRLGGKEGASHIVLLAASLPTLFAIYLLVLWSDVAEPHWPAAGYLSLYPSAAALLADHEPRSRRLYRVAVGYGIAVYAVMYLLVLTPLLPLMSPAGAYEPQYDLSNELRGWPEAREAIRAVNPKPRLVVAAFYTQCAQLAFALNQPEDPEVRCISSAIDDFDIWDGPFTLPDEGALFVSDNRFHHDIEALLPNGVVISRTLLDIRRSSVIVRRFELVVVANRRRGDQ